MSRRRVHDQIRSWANNPAAAEPEGEWLECTDAGFGALHVLAESESASDLGPRHWQERARRAISLGSSLRAGDHLVGHTPLHWCAWQGAPGVAAALLAAGAQPCSNRCGQTPSDICRSALRGSAPTQQSKLLSTLALLESAVEREALLSGLSPFGSDAPARATRL